MPYTGQEKRVFSTPRGVEKGVDHFPSVPAQAPTPGPLICKKEPDPENTAFSHPFEQLLFGTPSPRAAFHRKLEKGGRKRVPVI